MRKSGRNYKACRTYREDAFTEDDDVHVQRFQIRGAVWVLIEATETYEVVVPEQLDLLPGFFHLDILRCQGVDGEDLDPRKDTESDDS